MKVKWGALIVDGRNKIGGQVASKNRAGAYMRNKVTPVNPRSASQVGSRARLASISQAWAGLSESARASWNSAVSSFKKTDIFGDIKLPSGFNLFQRLNNTLVNLGQAIITIAPALVPVSIFATLSAAAHATGNTLVLTVTPATLPADENLIVRATAPQSAGKSFVKSEFRQIEIIDAVAAGSINIAAAYLAKFGSDWAVGSKIFIEVVHASTVSGQVSQAQQVVAVVAI